jgi:hypothetical protein
MVHLAKYGSAHLIHEVGWRLRKEVTREAYLHDLAYADDLRFSAHEWRGEDRDGKPMTISWIVTPTGTLLSAYEIQGRA